MAEKCRDALEPAYVVNRTLAYLYFHIENDHIGGLPFFPGHLKAPTFAEPAIVLEPCFERPMQVTSFLGFQLAGPDNLSGSFEEVGLRHAESPSPGCLLGGDRNTGVERAFPDPRTKIVDDYHQRFGT